MFEKHRLFEGELHITKTYQQYQQEHKAVRELECLKTQIPYTLRPTQEHDLFAGRFATTAVGFYPIMLGYIRDGYDKTGYCADMLYCKSMLEELESNTDMDAQYIQEVKDVIDFWEHENTVTKIRGAFTKEMDFAMTGDRYAEEIGVAYPLYRIAGTNLDYHKLLTYGLDGLVSLIETKIEETTDKDAVIFYESLIGIIDIVKHVIDTYMQEIKSLITMTKDEKRLQELNQILDSLTHIRDNKPETLHQAMQLVNIYAICTGSTELGRIDTYLGDFYANDIKNNTITRDEAVSYTISLFRLFGENLIRDCRALIGGKGRSSIKNADEYALVVMDAIDIRPVYLPQVSLRYYEGLDERLFDRALELLGKGITFPILYNDDVNVSSTMNAMDVPKEVAEQYSFFGCGEYMLANKSIGTPNILINMPKALELTLNNGIDPVTNQLMGLQLGEITDDMTFDELVNRYKQQLDFFIDQSGQFKELVYDKLNEETSFLFVSLLYDDCINRGKALFDGGIYHLGGTIETYGNITTSDSLAAIKEVVYEKQRFTLTQLVTMLHADFEGYEDQQKLLINAQKFGNDYTGADDVAVVVHEHVCNSIRDQREKTRLDSLLVVMINNNMNILLGKRTGATPDGRHKEAMLSNGNGAYAGRDVEGITSLMNSMTKLDTAIHAGATHNLKFTTTLFNDNREKTNALLKTFFRLGGQQTNISVVNQKDLEDAMIHPEKYENLMVRVGGFSSKFIHLDEGTQKDILMRTAY